MRWKRFTALSFCVGIVDPHFLAPYWPWVIGERTEVTS